MNWPASHTEELKRLMSDGVCYEVVAESINTKFGSSYTRKACIGRANRIKHRSAVADRRAWPQVYVDTLSALIGRGYTYSNAADRLNGEFGTSYSRNSCIGQMRRVNSGEPVKLRPPALPQSEIRKRANDKKRVQRWEANPALADRARRREEAQRTQAAQATENRARMRATNTPRTAACYRKSLPRLPEMTRSELRAMLTQAVQNTAAMGET